VLEKWTVLITLHGLLYGAHPNSEQAKEAIMNAERKSRGIVEGVKRASRASADERDSAKMEELDRTQARWMDVKEVDNMAGVAYASQGGIFVGFYGLCGLGDGLMGPQGVGSVHRPSYHLDDNTIILSTIYICIPYCRNL
jgi:hypothetical protein